MAQIIITDSPEGGDKWKEGLVRMSDVIDKRAIPDTLRQIIQNAGEQFKGLKERFKIISAQTSPAETEVQSLLKEAEAFSGILKQDALIIFSIQGKLDRIMAGGSLSASEKSLIANYIKMVCDCKKTLTTLQADVAKMLAFKFKNQHK